MPNSNEERDAVRATYEQRFSAVLSPLADELRGYIERCLAGQPRIDRIAARPKDIDKFVTKAFKLTEEGKRKYEEPLEEIQDQVGARIITFYLSDVERIDPLIKEWFRSIEYKDHVFSLSLLGQLE